MTNEKERRQNIYALAACIKQAKANWEKCDLSEFSMGDVSNLGMPNYAIAKWIYGKSGEAIECHCYGANGEPTLHKDGYSSWKTVFDAAGRDVGCKYYDIEGREIVVGQPDQK